MRIHGSKVVRRKPFKNPLEFGALEPKRMLTVGVGNNDCAPNLDLSGLPTQTVVFGQSLTVDLLNSGATVDDLDASGNPTGDDIRLLLDPDLGTDTPIGASITTDGNFSWTPTADQIGQHSIIVIAVDSGTPALADAETFIVNVVEENTAPNLTPIADQSATVGEELVVNLSATDPDTGQTLTFFLDPDDSPVGATLTDNGDGTAVVRWTPEASDLPGPTTFRVLVTDDASLPLVDSETFEVTLAASAVGLASISPASGEDLVNVERETIVRFDGEIDPATVTEDSFFVIANSERVAGRVVVSSTNRFATFFYDAPLPASTEIRVVVDGGVITDANGTPIDADGDLLPGGVATADFSTLPLTRIPGTNVFGFVRDSATGDPLVGVTIRIDAFPGLEAVTVDDDPATPDIDEAGRFELVDVPAPEFFVTIDGSTVTGLDAGLTYPTLGKSFTSTPGVTTQLSKDGDPHDIFLPLFPLEDVQTLSADEATDVGFGEAGRAVLADLFPDADPAMFDAFRVTFEPGSARDDAGNLATDAVVIPVSPDRLPAPLPAGIDPPLVVSIQAGIGGDFNSAGGATNFDVPAQVAFPNVDGLSSGEKTLVFSFDHDAGEWIANGTATVSEDGLVIVSDPGSGIFAPGWHATSQGSMEDRDVTPDPEEDDEEDEGDTTFRYGIDFPGSFQPFRAGVTADFSVPFVNAEVESALNGLRDSLNSFEIAIPDEPIPFDFGVSGTFTVDELFDQFVPTFNRELFGVELFVGVSVSGALTGRFEVDPDGELEIEVGGEITATFGVTVELENSFICGLEIADVEIGEILCGPHALLGFTRTLGAAEFIDFDLPLPTTTLDEIGSEFFSISVGLEAGSRASVTPTVFIEEVESSPFSRTALASFGSEAALFESTEISATENSFAISTFVADQNPYYRYIFDSGIEIAGQTTASGRIEEIVPANESFNLFVFDPRTNTSSFLAGTSSSTGTTNSSPIAPSQVGGLDADHDGLSDIAEFILGADSSNPDTDGDGVSDLAELEQGLNPLDGIAATTGVQASLELPGTVEAIATANNLVYAATGSHGLVIVDASAFDLPISLGAIDLPGNATGVGFDPTSGVAAVATGTGLQLVDVSDPMLPTLLETVGIGASQVEVFGGFAFATSGNGLSVVDLLTGDVISSLLLPGAGNVTGLARQGTELYAYISGSDTLAVIDISRPETPTILGQTNVDVASTDVGIAAGNGLVWLAGSGLRTVNVSDPTNPILQHGADSFFTASRVALNGSGLGLVLPDGGSFVQVYDTSNPDDTDEFLTQFPLSGNANALAISRGIGFVGAGNRLEVVNYRPFDSGGVAPSAVATVSAEDADPGTPGIQALEGGLISVTAEVTDDVQVRDVQLLVNGEVVATDVSFPFDFVAPVPSAATGENFTVEVRATDTGGNETLSDPVILAIVPDTFAPVIETVTPADGASRFFGARATRVRFNEALNTELVSDAAFRIVSPGENEVFGDADDVIIPANVTLRDNDQLVQITAIEDLLVGAYRLEIDESLVEDRASNALGDGLFTSDFTIIERPSVDELFDLVGEEQADAFVLDGTDIQLGINADGSFIGAGVGLEFAGTDFLEPGTPLAGYTVGFNGSNFTNSSPSNGTDFAVNLQDLSAGDFHGVRAEGLVNDQLQFERVAVFNEGEQFITIAIRLTNVSDATVTDVAFLENLDPDQGTPIGVGAETTNDVVLDGELGLASVVNADFPAGLTIGLGSGDPRATVSIEQFFVGNPFDIIDSPIDPDGGNGDNGLNIAFNIGELAPGESTSIAFALVLGRSTDEAIAIYESTPFATPDSVATALSVIDEAFAGI